MRVLLVNPGMNTERLGRFARLLEPMPCIGLAYVAASLREAGFRVRAVDMFAEDLSIEAVMERVQRFRPQVVGLTVMTPSVPICQRLTRRIRRALPGCRVVWGGVHADVFGEEIVRNDGVDAVVHGDGEAAMVELVRSWASGGEPADVLGITWSHQGEPVRNAPRPLERDLDSLPYPAWDLFPVHRYGLLPFADMARPVLTMSASRGCPYRCDYCSLIHTGGKVFRRRDPVRVVDEYEHLVNRYGVRQVGFVDPIFPLVREDLPVLCEEMIRRRLHERCIWLSETRADRLDAATCELMYAAGCRRVLLGIESGSDRLLENVHKTQPLDKVRAGVAHARRAGIQTVGLFMIGLPGETPEDTLRTVDFAVELDLDFAKFAITVPFPGSRLFAESWQRTLFRDDWENYTTFNPDPDRLIYHPEGYDPRVLVRMQSLALRRFYGRLAQIERQLWDLRTLSPQVVARGVYGALLG